ncbi:MAG: TIGR02597 family protein [Candidatus Omnitrophica bacterium]|nr:TIGR02597 family protein [Candidatus Omnitrophota bacterium]
MRIVAITAVVLLALAAQSAFAEAVGYNRIVIPAESDVLLTAPFSQDLEGEYTVSGLGGTSDVTVTDALESGAYAGDYYVRFTSGDASGLWTTISANGVNSFTLENLEVYEEVSIGDTFRVYKHHTLDSIFPRGQLNKSFTYGTIVQFFENPPDGETINKSFSKSASYRSSGGGTWRGTGAGLPIEPETLFIVRNPSEEDLELILKGDVPDYSVSILITDGVALGDAGDRVIGSGYPLPVPLKGSGLEGTFGRVVQFFDNSATGINKSFVKSASYRSTGGGTWRGSGADESIGASESVTLRLPSGEAVKKVTITKPY